MVIGVCNAGRLQSRNVQSAIWMEHHLVHVGYKAFDLRFYTNRKQDLCCVFNLWDLNHTSVIS